MYWFRYEPIVWRILEEKEGCFLLLADSILDAQQYDHAESDYPLSDIRAFLKWHFLPEAFTAEERDELEKLAHNANQKALVFLPNKRLVTSATYGFMTDANAEDPARQRKGTDYARIQGLGSTQWWLFGWESSTFFNVQIEGRPSDFGFGKGSRYAPHVLDNGKTEDLHLKTSTDVGIVPAIRVLLR